MAGDKGPGGPPVKAARAAGGRGRPSVWAANAPPMRKPAQAPPVTLFVVLTSWHGTRIAVRYTTGRSMPMERHPMGGSYLFFPHGMLYVRESPGEINARIYARLQQLQAAWTPVAAADVAATP